METKMALTKNQMSQEAVMFHLHLRTGQGLERRYVDEEDGGWVKFRGLLLVLCPPGVSGPHEATTVTKHPP